MPSKKERERDERKREREREREGGRRRESEEVTVVSRREQFRIHVRTFLDNLGAMDIFESEAVAKSIELVWHWFPSEYEAQTLLHSAACSTL